MKMLEHEKFFDDRGYVGWVYKDEPDSLKFVEDRVSYSTKGTIRGFHGDVKTYKYCICVYGKLHFITYDLTNRYKQEFILDHKDQRGILISPYTLNAHQCLSDECVLLYKWTEHYNRSNQWSVYWNDNTINPKWTLPPTYISGRDQAAPELPNANIPSVAI